MLQAQQPTILPTTFDAFLQFEPTDGFKYEWNDGELLRTGGMKPKHSQLIQVLNLLFDKTKAKQLRGQLICKQDVMLTGLQMRRPDMAYFSDEQIHSEA